VVSIRKYLFRRLLQIIPFVLLTVAFNFVLINLAPGDPAAVIAGEDASTEYVEALRKEYGLDKPIIVRLGIYLKHFVTLDLGYSYAFNRPVIDLILERIPNTLLLVVVGKIIAIFLGIILGVWSAGRFGSKIDNLFMAITVVMYSAPVFWVGIILILVFAVKLDWLPTSGIMSMSWGLSPFQEFVDRIKHLVLPLTTMVITMIPIYIRTTRASVIEVKHEDFILTARAKGLTEREILIRHALKNALLAPVTMAGISFGLVFTGSLLVETIFAWPGLGRLMYQAIFRRDYPLLMGIFAISALSVMIFSLLTDLIYMVLDPRVRLEQKTK